VPDIIDAGEGYRRQCVRRMTASPGAGRYTRRSLLGRGGMGEVFAAYDERLRRHVAIKRIRTAEGEGKGEGGGEITSRRARLEQEAHLLAQLGHPAIVQVFDVFEDEGGDWVVMELVLGRTLAAVLDEAPVSIDHALSYGHAIAGALDAAHRHGIIHRDLKLENVMLSEPGQIKILDFGLAKQLVPHGDAAALSLEGQVLGTVRAMSPEQARGLEVDERSDLFSLGVLLYELLAGLTPFAGATPLDTIVRVSTHRQTSLAELPGTAERIPHALSELVDQLLEKAAELRPPSAAVVRDRLHAIAASRPRPAPAGSAPDHDGVAEPSSTHQRRAQLGEPETQISRVGLAAGSQPPRGPRAGRRRLWLAGLGAAVAVSVIGILIGSTAKPSPSRAPSLTSAPASPLAAGPPVAPAPSRDPRAEYERGMALLRDFHRPGAIDEAAGVFQRLLREDEGSAPAYAGLARAYWYRYRVTDASRDSMFLSQAQAAADRAVALDAFLVDARLSHGLVALELGQVEQAERDVQAALALDGKNADVYDAMAQLHRHQQRLDEAEAAYRTAITLAPRARQLYDDLGGLQVERGEYQEAIPLFEKSIALAPDSPYGYSNLGAVYLLQGRYDAAAQRFQDALKIRPSSSLYSNLGTVLFAQGLYGPAAVAFERALAMGGAANDYLRWANLADAYRQLPDAAGQARDHYDQAITLIDAELARSPQDPTLRSRRALYLAKRGDCQRADTGLASLIDARDLTPYAVFRIAVTLEICGHRPRALAALDRALASGFSLAEIGNDPELRALRADPAYHLMVQRRGQPSITAPSPR
jgi:serine/threonine protein kinase/tetratricopeptide (TPR) repeat protein